MIKDGELITNAAADPLPLTGTDNALMNVVKHHDESNQLSVISVRQEKVAQTVLSVRMVSKSGIVSIL